MKNLLSSIAFLAVMALAAGCHAQIPPTTAQVTVSWGLPAAAGTWAGCTVAQPCTPVISRATVASSGTACPATTGTAYAQVGTATANGTSYVDTAPPTGAYACWVIQLQQGTPTATGPASGATNGGTALAIPATPLAPVQPSAGVTVAALDKPTARQPAPAPTAASGLAPPAVTTATAALSTR